VGPLATRLVRRVVRRRPMPQRKRCLPAALHVLARLGNSDWSAYQQHLRIGQLCSGKTAGTSAPTPVTARQPRSDRS